MSHLILTRFPGQITDITINGVSVQVTVTKISSGGCVVLAFDAPRDVTIHRREITERIKAEGKMGDVA